MLTDPQAIALVSGVAILAIVEWTWIVRSFLRVERLRRVRGGR